MKTFLASLLFVGLVFVNVPMSFAQSQLDRAIADYRAENFEEAVQSLTKIRQQEPSNPLAAFYLGLAHKQTGNLQEAIKNFEDSLSLPPRVNDAYAEVVEAYYNIGDDTNAMRWIKEAEAESVTPAKISFLKGMVLMRQEDNKGAIHAFNRSKELDPAFTQAADVKLALIYAKNRRLKDARKYLKNVMTADPNSDLAQFAKEYDRSINEAIESYKGFNAIINIAYQYDDNVKTQDAYGNIKALSPTLGKESSGIASSITLTYTPMPEGPFMISTMYNFTANYYNRIHENHLAAHTVSLIPGYSSGRLSFLTPLGYTYVQMAGPDAGNGKLNGYMGLASIRPTLRYAFNDYNLAEFALGFVSRRLFREQTDPLEDKNGKIYSGAISYIRPFSKPEGSLVLRYEYTIDDAKGPHADNKAHKVGAAVNIHLPFSLIYGLSADYAIQRYDNINANMQAKYNFKRNDDIYTLNTELSKEVYKRLSTFIKYSYTHSKSNIQEFYYKRNIYFAGLEYRF